MKKLEKPTLDPHLPKNLPTPLVDDPAPIYDSDCHSLTWKFIVYRNCLFAHETPPHFPFKRYSLKKCLVHCTYREAVKLCGCKPWDIMPLDVINCICGHCNRSMSYSLRRRRPLKSTFVMGREPIASTARPKTPAFRPAAISACPIATRIY